MAPVGRHEKVPCLQFWQCAHAFHPQDRVQHRADEFRREQQACADRAERFTQRGIVKLADDTRLEASAREPGFDEAAGFAAFTGQQQWRAGEARRKPRPIASSQRSRAVYGDGGARQQRHAQPLTIDRRAGHQHGAEAACTQIFQQFSLVAFAADQSRCGIECKHGLEQAAGHEFGDDLVDADREGRRLSGGALQSAQQVFTAAQHFGGVLEHQFARIGEPHAASDALEQFHTEPILQHAELTGNGLRSDGQSVRRCGNGAGARDGAQVGELHEIEVPEVQVIILKSRIYMKNNPIVPDCQVSAYSAPTDKGRQSCRSSPCPPLRKPHIALPPHPLRRPRSNCRSARYRSRGTPSGVMRCRCASTRMSRHGSISSRT